ncbi:MAG: GtrA family protein [Gallionella sp.]|nr:GtrA family protein [Gallionella sp.]
MSRWQSESAYLARYASSGALNTIAGFAVIFLLMWMGTSPFIANICGYLVGLVLGFFVSRKFVFRSEGHFTSEGLRYFAAFLFCFALNLLVLDLALGRLYWNPNLAQLAAAVTYTASMYLLSRRLVFSPHNK